MNIDKYKKALCRSYSILPFLRMKDVLPALSDWNPDKSKLENTPFLCDHLAVYQEENGRLHWSKEHVFSAEAPLFMLKHKAVAVMVIQDKVHLISADDLITIKCSLSTLEEYSAFATLQDEAPIATIYSLDWLGIIDQRNTRLGCLLAPDQATLNVS